MKRIIFPWMAPLILGLSLAGCGVRGAYVMTGPPPPRAEAFGVAPGPGFVWVSGYWGWGGGRYEWVPGRWERPPHPHDRWIAPRWEQRGGRYHFVPGRWGR